MRVRAWTKTINLVISKQLLTLNKNTLSLEQEADDGCGDDDEEEE